MNTHTTALDSARKNPLEGKGMPAAKKRKNGIVEEPSANSNAGLKSEAVDSLAANDGKFSARLAERPPKNDDSNIQSVACVANGVRNGGQQALFVSSQPLTIQSDNFHFQKLSYHECFMWSLPEGFHRSVEFQRQLSQLRSRGKRRRKASLSSRVSGLDSDLFLPRSRRYP